MSDQEHLPPQLDVTELVENMMSLRESATILVNLHALQITTPEHAHTVKILGEVIQKQNTMLSFMCEKYISLAQMFDKSMHSLDEAIAKLEGRE